MIRSGNIGIQSSANLRNQHEVVSRVKHTHDLSNDLQKEKEHSQMIQKLLEKALKELKYYVDRFGSYANREQDDMDSVKEDQIGTHHEFTFNKLEPLLLAYEEAILEQKHALDYYKEQVRILEENAKSYVADNQVLRDELQKKCQMLLDIYQNGNPTDQIANIYRRIQRDDLTEKVQKLTEENEKLTTQFKEENGKLREKTREVQDLTDKIKRLEAKSQRDNQQIEQLSEQNSSLQAQASEVRKQFDNSEKKLSQLKLRYSKLEHENLELTKSGARYKEQLEQLDKKLQESERDFQQQNGQLDQLLRTKEREIKEQSSEIIKLEKHNQQIEQDIQKHRAKMHEQDQENQKLRLKQNEQEKKLELLEAKEQQFLKSLQNQQEKENQLVHERDQLSAQNRKLENVVNGSEEQHKIQIDAIKNEKDRVIEQLKHKAKSQNDENSKVIEDLTAENYQLQIYVEKLQKDNHKSKAERDELNHLWKNEKFRLEHENEYMKKKTKELEEEIQRRERYFDDKQSASRLEKEQLQLQNNNLQQLVTELKAINEQLRKKASQYEVQTYELKDEVNNMKRSQMQNVNSKIMRSQQPNY